jgi:nucleoside-diphosphate-sugar epimerase
MTRNISHNVQRVVVTSSVVTVQTLGRPEPRVLTEEDWNETSVQEVQEQGRHAQPMSKYRAAKTLAEKGVLLLQDLKHD